MPVIKLVKVAIKLMPDAKLVFFCRARKFPLTMEAQVKIELAKLRAQKINATVDPGGVVNASPVSWQGKKTDLLVFVQTSKFMK